MIGVSNWPAWDDRLGVRGQGAVDRIDASTAADADATLVAQAQGGDLEAFGRLVDRYQRPLVAFGRAMLSGSPDAEDVAQEAFVRAYRALGQFRGASSFKTWLYQIAANVARTYATRRVGRAETSAETETGSIFDRTPSRDDFERGVLVREQVTRALAALPDDWREAVVLRDMQGLDYREIAAVLNVPIGTVESRIFRGRERLRAALRAPSAPGATA